MMDEPDNLKQSEPMTISRRGFSMMEMMAVIAVIAILATLAVPSYLERIVRDQIKESLPLADIAKKPIAEAWAATPLSVRRARPRIPRSRWCLSQPSRRAI